MSSASFDERLEVGQLRTDVAVDANDFEGGFGGRHSGRLRARRRRRCQFVGFQARGDVGMGFGIDIGLTRRGNGAVLPKRSATLNVVDFGNAFHIEAFHACIKRELDFPRLCFWPHA